jgi:hypothetical protein
LNNRYFCPLNIKPHDILDTSAYKRNYERLWARNSKIFGAAYIIGAREEGTNEKKSCSVGVGTDAGVGCGCDGLSPGGGLGAR